MLELKTLEDFMWLTQFRWPALLMAFLSLAACVNNTSHQPNVVTVKRVVIVTPVPAPKEVIVIPAGYVNCTVVPGRWMYSTWIPQHHVCRYAHNVKKVTWVEGYWACTKYSQMSGQCKHWKWHSSEWYNRVVMY